MQILIKPPKWLEWLEAAGLRVHISVSARQHQCLVNVLHRSNVICVLLKTL